MIELEKYEIVGEIGRGGMATVYKARHRVLHSHVAIKVLSGQFTHDGEFLKRFINGARSAASLKHENIIPVYDVGDEKGNYYIVMEYLEGETLEDRVKRAGAIPEPEIEAIMKPLAGALEYAHSRGVVHRDIKSANIFLVKGGRVVLMDFDIAKASDATLNLTQDGTLLGTPAYMSPEQARGEKADHRSDVYSFGVVLYEMATGRLPFQGENTFSILNQIATTDPPPPREFNPKLGGELGDRILWCMQKSPADRPAKASEIFGGTVPGRKARKDKKKGTGFGFGKGKGKKDEAVGKKAALAEAPAEGTIRAPEAPGAPPQMVQQPVPAATPTVAPAPAAANTVADSNAAPAAKGREESPAIDLNAITRPRKKRRGIGRKTSRAVKKSLLARRYRRRVLRREEQILPRSRQRRRQSDLLRRAEGSASCRLRRTAPQRSSPTSTRKRRQTFTAGRWRQIGEDKPDKAYEKFSAIRKIDPGNLLAHQGAQKLYDWHIARAEGKFRAGDYQGFEGYMDRAVRFSPSMKLDNLRQRASSYRSIRRYVSLDSHNAAVVYIKIAGAQAGKLIGKLTGSAGKKLKSI